MLGRQKDLAEGYEFLARRAQQEREDRQNHLAMESRRLDIEESKIALKREMFELEKKNMKTRCMNVLSNMSTVHSGGLLSSNVRRPTQKFCLRYSSN